MDPSFIPVRRRIPIIALVLIAVCVKATGAPAGAAKKPIYVTASFLDRNGLLIEDLQMGEVEIYEDNKLRKIEFMAKDDLPTVYGMLFDRSMFPDVSESTRVAGQTVRNSVLAREIACQLIDKELARHTVWVGAYDQLLQIARDASKDAFAAKDAINQLSGISFDVYPFLYSALFSAVDKMEQRREKRRILILFLEAVDPQTASRTKALKSLLASSNVELFVICLISHRTLPGAVPSGVTTSPLKELAQATSGYTYFAADYSGHVDDLVRRLLSHFRTLYTFGFTSEPVPKGKGKLIIKCSRPDSSVRCHPDVPFVD